MKKLLIKLADFIDGSSNKDTAKQKYEPEKRPNFLKPRPGEFGDEEEVEEALKADANKSERIPKIVIPNSIAKASASIAAQSDIITQILSFLNTSELKVAKLVSRQWYHAAVCDDIWLKFLCEAITQKPEDYSFMEIYYRKKHIDKLEEREYRARIARMKYMRRVSCRTCCFLIIIYFNY